MTRKKKKKSKYIIEINANVLVVSLVKDREVLKNVIVFLFAFS
jgi:hypothetical protein